MAVISNVSCPVCGCLCDDIELVVEKNVIPEVRNACGMGESKFLGYSAHRPLKPLIRKNGELIETSMAEAVKRSAEILANASYPILYGWGKTRWLDERIRVEVSEGGGG